MRKGVRMRGEVRHVASEDGAGRQNRGRLGGRCPGCLVSAGVCCRTRLRWPAAVSASRHQRKQGRVFRSIGAASEHGRFNRRRQVQRWFEHRCAAGVIQRSERSGRECVFFQCAEQTCMVSRKFFSEPVGVVALSVLNALRFPAAFERPGRRNEAAGIRCRR